MTAALALIDTLNAAGLTATLTSSGAVRITPTIRLTDDLRAIIRANLEGLRDWLQAANDPAPFDFFRPKKGQAAEPDSQLTQICNPSETAPPGNRLAQISNPGKSDPGKGCDLQSDPLDAPMTPSEINTFTARVLLFMRRGLAVRSAETLADKLKRRDRDHDDRRCCIECRCLSNRTCTAWRKAGVGSPSLPGELIEMLQRCPAYAPAITITEDHHD